VVRLLFRGFCPSVCFGLSHHVYPNIIYLALVRHPLLAHLWLFSPDFGKVLLVVSGVPYIYSTYCMHSFSIFPRMLLCFLHSFVVNNIC
jgi:hypothetical protein